MSLWVRQRINSTEIFNKFTSLWLKWPSIVKQTPPLNSKYQNCLGLKIIFDTFSFDNIYMNFNTIKPLFPPILRKLTHLSTFQATQPHLSLIFFFFSRNYFSPNFFPLSHFLQSEGQTPRSLSLMISFHHQHTQQISSLSISHFHSSQAPHARLILPPSSIVFFQNWSLNPSMFVQH